jgi:hypothetical protein
MKKSHSAIAIVLLAIVVLAMALSDPAMCSAISPVLGMDSNGCPSDWIPEPAPKPDPAPEPIPFSPSIVGFCPTMAPYAKALSDVGFTTIAYSSTSQALLNLGQGNIDMALIGRAAELGEIGPGISGELLKDGYALIGPEKLFIDSSIPLLHTAIPEAELNKLPQGLEIVRHESPGEAIDAAIKAGNTNAALIYWSEFSSDYCCLVTPVIGPEKIGLFRSPHAYYIDGEKADIGLARELIAGM